MKQLRDYQQADVEIIKQRDCIGIFSEQRTGKTPTVIRGLWEKGIRRPLIVCPNSMVYVWASEWETWTGTKAQIVTDTKHLAATKTKPKRTVPFDVRTWGNTALIINYEKLRDTRVTEGMWERLLKQKPEAIVIDEAHRIKTRPTRSVKAHTTQAVFKFIKVPVRIAITGTPAPNHEWDVYNILHFLAPTIYKSYYDFIAQYFEQDSIWIGGKQHLEPARFKLGMDKLFQQNLDILCIQHKRAEVMSWIEEVQPLNIKLPCTTLQKKYLKGLTEMFETEHIITQGVLDNLIRVRQVCSAPAILGLKGNSPKLDWLCQYIQDYPKKQILVFSNSKALLTLFWLGYMHLFSMSIITGDVPALSRQVSIDQFQSNRIQVLLIQTQAGKEGLTLDNADGTIFLDAYPPAADYSQAKDRMVATTPERVKPKELINLMMADTYDEQLFKLVEDNISSTAVVNDYINYVNRRK